MESQTLDKDWCSLFGKDLKSPEIQEILNTSSDSKFEHKVFKDSEGQHDYFFSYSLGVSLSFKNEVFSSIFLYGKYDKKFKPFSGKLPYFFTLEFTNSDVVAFLGEPNRKSGGRTVPISISYERLGIEFSFMLPIWDISDNRIGMVCLFPKSIEKEHKICGLCAKQAESNCSQCKLALYCSTKCQSVHWKVHKIHCNKFYKVQSS